MPFWGINSGWADDGDGCELFVIGWGGPAQNEVQSVTTLVDMDGFATMYLVPEITVNSLLENMDSNTWLFEKTIIDIDSVLEDISGNAQLKTFFPMQAVGTLDDISSNTDINVLLQMQSVVSLQDMGSATQIDQIPGIFSNVVLGDMISEVTLRHRKSTKEFGRQGSADGDFRTTAFRTRGSRGGFGNRNRRGKVL